MNETEEHSHFQGNDYEDDLDKINALNLAWTMGMNYTIVNGAHNLTTEDKTEIFYAAAHTGVIYDYRNKTQRLLQGHCNKITCTAYCPVEDIIITADAGADSMLVVWDARTGVPRKTIFDPHPNGVECLDITSDGSHIVTISKEEKPTDRQEVTVWNWKSPGNSRVISHPVHEKVKDYIKYVIFNPAHPQEFATTGKKRILFWTWENEAQGYEFYGPSYSDRKADFTQTVFIPNSSQAVTGTTDGHIVVWDISLIMEDYSQPEERRKIKVVNLMNTGNKSETASKKPVPAINILKIQGNYLVVGSSNGSIRFYDFQYTIVAWFEDIGIGNITSISFSRRSPAYGKSIDEDHSKSSFDCPDFIIVDSECTVHMLRASQFDQIEAEQKKPEILMKLLKSPIRCMAVRPNSNYIAISCKNGNLYEWDYYEKTPILQPLKCWEEKYIPTCIEYSPDGKFLAVANSNGVINFFDYKKGDWQPFSQSLQVSSTQDHIPKVEILTFAPDSKHLAVADHLMYVSLFKIDHKFGDPEQPKEWQFVLKNRAHLGKIRALAFGETFDEHGERLKLFSIGEDKRLVEYDIYASQGKSGDERLAVTSIFQIEQETNPCACIWYPINQLKENVLLTVNEDYKIKLWNTNQPDQKVTRKTCLGPTYGGPINKLITIRGNDKNDAYLAYSTAEKIVGLIKLPIDGNPNNSMGLIAHPEAITGIGVSSDGKYLFTSGGDDFTVNMWIIDLSVIDQNALLQNHDDIFPDLLEGGRDGQTYRDLKDFFYYSQIRSKKENTTKARKLEGTVPLEEIPNLMRALGYYPTQKEIENMQNEIRYSEILDAKGTIEECNLKTFVALFVNHRPVYGIGKKNIEEALNIITGKKEPGEKAIITNDELIQILKTRGEKMSDQELEYCFNILLGEGGIDNYPEIDADILAKDILGFEELNEEAEQGENYESY